MTDKEIITKDVDTRGCKFFRNGICASPINPKCKLCVEISEKMCYYKQLKRKEQELIDYKKQFKADTKEMEDYQNEIARHLQSIEYWYHQAEAKEQECEELKEELEELKELKEENEYNEANAIEFKQALIEIKKLAKCGWDMFMERNSYEDYEAMAEWMKNQFYFILQKISEVEDE